MFQIPAELPNDDVVKARLPKLARKRLERFVTLFPKTLVSDAPETIHDLRVASRRLQQTLRLLPRKPRPSNFRKPIRVLRKVRRVCGPCRNLDVTIELIQKKLDGATATSLKQGWEAVQLSLEQQRASAIGKARIEIKRHDLIDFITRVQSRIESFDQDSEGAALLWKRAQETLATWDSALASARSDPQVELLHAFRIAGKRLRYQVELLADLGITLVKPLVQDLKVVQDQLGHWHDRCVLRDHVAEFIGQREVLAQHPGMCRALLLEMERDKQRDTAAIKDVLANAGRLSDSWSELNPDEARKSEILQA
jgi:CHAD domain-containing protein